MSDAIEQAAHHDITEVLLRYAAAIDRRDWELFHTCFTDDCHADYGDIGAWESLDAITAFMIDAHAELGHTLHRLSNFTIAVQADHASARSYVDAVLVTPDGQTCINAIGYYDDELVATAAGWRIAKRNFTPVRLAVLGPT
jgi:3-phenylpropionate/cinnamic acid dioxygenase small subunit